MATLVVAPLAVLCYVHLCSGYSSDQQTKLAINEGIQYDPNVQLPKRKFVINFETYGPTWANIHNYTALLNVSRMTMDKTLLIKEILQSPHSAILISYPRRWGKTVNSHMIKNFVQIEVDQNGNKLVPETETYMYKIFKHGDLSFGKKLREPLLISKEDDLFTKYRGKYPAIFAQFYFYGIDNIGHFDRHFKDKIGDVFIEHRYMINVFQRIINSTDSTAEAKSKAEKNLDTFMKFMGKKAPNRYEMFFCLHFLSQILYEHFNQKVYMFIDDYDDIINYSFLEHDHEERFEIIDYFVQFLRVTLLDNPYIERSIVTGITSVIKNLTDGDKNFEHFVNFNMFSNPYHKFYGYDHAEMQYIYDFLNIDSENQTVIEQWYDGYFVNLASPIRKIQPRTLNVYLRYKQHRFFFDSIKGTMEPLIPRFVKIPGFEELWFILLSGSNYTLPIRSFPFTNDKYRHLSDAINTYRGETNFHGHPGNPETVDIIAHYLLTYGYATIAGIRNETRDGVLLYDLKMPNLYVIYTWRNSTFWNYFQFIYCLAKSYLFRHTVEMEREFVQFIANDDEENEVLQDSYLYYYNRTVLEQDLKKQKTDIPRYGEMWRLPINLIPLNYHFMRSALYFFFGFSHTFRIHDCNFYAYNGIKPDLMATRERRALVINIRYVHGNGNDSEIGDVRSIINSSYADVFRYHDDFKHIVSVKLVALHVQHMGKVTLRGWKENIRSSEGLEPLAIQFV